ncbi:hypothetical protein POTOM_037343 [Populus tomentosa]|uniref:F-box domain-containing protein n=1 Tax=Populus tomentosa TaxID=118781 RepID=A0A8X8CKC0_POPTO|nr:hypothetical protein POTOM_037343 [Populus tomentosa]
MTGSLPLDIISHILSRLPVKSLLPFKCLRKSWCSLFSDPQFIRVHFNVAITDNYVKHLRQRLLFSHPLIITQSTVVDHEARSCGLICVSSDPDTVAIRSLYQRVHDDTEITGRTRIESLLIGVSDLVEEEFRDVPPPLAVKNFYTFQVFGGCLCILPGAEKRHTTELKESTPDILNQAAPS